MNEEEAFFEAKQAFTAVWNTAFNRYITSVKPKMSFQDRVSAACASVQFAFGGPWGTNQVAKIIDTKLGDDLVRLLVSIDISSVTVTQVPTEQQLFKDVELPKERITITNNEEP